MNEEPKVAFTSRHGVYEASPLWVDIAINRYLPASPERMREVLKAEVDSQVDWADIDVSSALVILADVLQAGHHQDHVDEADAREDFALMDQGDPSPDHGMGY